MQAHLTTLPLRVTCKHFLAPELLVKATSSNNRLLSTTPPHLKKPSSLLPPRPTLPDGELKHAYLKGSGPGGQKINKTSSAVQLTHLPTGIVVKSQATRSRSQNHTIARRILAEKIELLEKGTESRAAKKIERASKKKASAAKKSRRKYRKLEDEKGGDEVAHPVGLKTSGLYAKKAAAGALAEDLNDNDIQVDEVDDVEWTDDETDGDGVTADGDGHDSEDQEQTTPRFGNKQLPTG